MDKYKQSKLSDDMFVGVIKDFDGKKLSCVEKVPSDFKITSSESWFRHQIDELKFRRDQFGSFFITFTVEVPQASLDVLATCLVQEGYVVTVEKKGSATGEFDIEYIVHLDHKSDEDCSDDCTTKIALVDFLETQTFDLSSLGNKHVGTYTSSVSQKLTAFVKHIIQAPTNGLYSENYFVTLVFDLEGKASMLGVIWPKELEAINLDFSQNGENITLKDEMLKFIDRNICASCDPRMLRSALNVSECEANLLSALVKKHQFSKDSPPRLPSLRTLLTQVGSLSNCNNAKLLLKCMTEQLNSLTCEERDTLSTYDWLDLVWEEVIGDISDDNKFFTVSFPVEEIMFEIDEKLSSFLTEYESPLTAVYHYALSCCLREQEYGVIFRRLKIADCYMAPFNTLFLKAADAMVTVKLGRSLKMFENILLKRNEDALPSRLSSPNLILTHREISLVEGLYCFDKTKKRTNPCSSVGFVNTKARRMISFKKVKTTGSANNFKIEGLDDEFEMMSTIISRHFSRINGMCLLLAETVTWFEFVGKDKSKELYETYINSLDKIALSDTKCVSSSDDSGMLPNFILCNNGDVLKKRKKKCVLVYPLVKTNYDMMYSRLLLFFPLEREDDLCGDLREKFTKEHEDRQGTVVNVNERRLFPFKVQNTLDAQLVYVEESSSEEDETSDDEAALDCLNEALEDQLDKSDLSKDDELSGFWNI